MSTSQTPLENPYLEKSPANGVKARSKLKTLTKPHSVYVRPIVSFSVISAVFVLILLASENAAFRGMPLADAGEWGIATHTITNNVRIVWAVLLAIVSGIFINCLFYIEDLTEAQSSYEVLTGNKSGKITLSKCLNSLAIFLCLVWLIFLISEAHMDAWDTLALIPDPVKVMDPLFYSSVISFVLFVLFGFEDRLLFKSSLTVLLAYDETESNKIARQKIEATKKYANDSFWLIDVPVILGSLLLIGFTFLEQSTSILGNGLTESAKYFYPSGEMRNPEFLDNSAMLRTALNAPVQIGFAGGSHVTQLFISQVIFWVLAFRVNVKV